MSVFQESIIMRLYVIDQGAHTNKPREAYFSGRRQQNYHFSLHSPRLRVSHTNRDQAYTKSSMLHNNRVQKMDVQGEGKKKSDDFRHCSLCMEAYSVSTRTPKLLPCFHTFCLPCLITLTQNSVAEELEKKDGEDKEGQAATSEDEGPSHEAEELDAADLRPDFSDAESVHSETSTGKMQDGKLKKSSFFRCPTCRDVIPIPPLGLRGLQTNFYVTADLEASAEEAGEEDKGRVLCEMCEDGHGEDARHYCRQCQQRMCQACRRLHDRVTGAGSHQVESFSDLSRSPTAGSGGRGMKKCQFHPDQLLCFHCCKCDVTICLHCKLTSHEGHDTQDMATAAVQAKEEMGGLRARADQQLLLLEACISRLERDELDMQRQKQDVSHQVSSRYDQLIGWATQARDEFLEEVAAKEQAFQSDLHMKKASASFFKGNLLSKKMRASQTTTSLGSDVVLLKNELQGALLKDEALGDYQELAARKTHRAFFTNFSETSVLELAIVRAFMGELVEASADGGDLPDFSFWELAQAVTRMQAELKEMKDKVPVNNKVSFHAKMSANSSYNVNQKIVFDQVLNNEGNGYNNGTGIFTAPAEGTYIFTTTARNCTNGYNYNVALMVKGVEWARTFTPESSTVHCVAPLKEGEQVWVHPPLHNIQFAANACMFSGALISL